MGRNARICILQKHAYTCMPIIPALRRLRQKNENFQDSLGYITKSCLKKKKK
jgi:hypothetical protein